MIVTVYPANSKTISLKQTTVTGGNSTVGTLTLNGAAGSNGTTVGLESSNGDYAQVPASVFVKAGQTTATFPVTTLQVLSEATVTIASKDGGGAEEALTVIPLALSSFSLSPVALTGGAPAVGTVSLTAPIAIDALFVNITSSNTAGAKPQYAQIDFGTKGQSSQVLSIYTLPVAAATTVTITASYNGISKAQSLTVNPANLTAVSVSPTSVVGGKSATGTVTLYGRSAAPGTVVTLTSNSSSAVEPTSVKVLAGQLSVTFLVTTKAVTKTTTVIITAKWNTLVKTTTLTLSP